MQMMFIRDVPKRYKLGDIRDYPLSTWRVIAGGAKKLSKVALPIEEATPIVAAAKAAAAGKGGSHAGTGS